MIKRSKKNLTRKIPVLFMFNEDEYEYLHRAAKAKRKNGKVASFIRDTMFRGGWEFRLISLRLEQGANIK